MKPVYKIITIEYHGKIIMLVGDVMLGNMAVLNNHIVTLNPKKVMGKDIRKVLDATFTESLVGIPLDFIKKVAQVGKAETVKEKKSLLDRLRGI